MLKQFFTTATFLVILSSCGKMKNPEFRGIESVSMEDVKLGTNTIRLNLKYYNPNSFKGQLKWAEGDAWVDSSFLGHFTVDTALKVPARQEFIVPVKLNVSMQDMLMVAAPLLSEKKTAIWLRVSGQARAGRSGVYKTVPLKYAGKQSLEGLVKE
jgi:LEA14-like dessication related protein